MKKFEIRKKHIEILYKNRNSIKEGITSITENNDAEIIESFDTLEKAKEELQKYKSSVTEFSNGRRYCLVEEFYIEENSYDDDGEWIEGGNICEFSKLTINYELRNNSDTEVIFTDLQDAKTWYMPDLKVFPEQKEYAKEIEEAESLKDLAEVLNKYTDIFDNGSHYTVKEIWY